MTARPVVLLGLLGGCGGDVTRPGYEVMPEMMRSVPYDAFAPNPVTRDGKTLMAPAAGSIARGAAPFHYGPGPTEAARAGREVTSPIPPSAATLARGERVFQVFCSPCHGRGGDGDGPIVPRFPAPPSLKAAHARSLADGQMFHVVTRGQGLMPSLASQVRPEDRWKAIQHVRSLQTAGASR
ncbi:MAG: cytochrome c [Myxococcota bacterium]